MFGRTTDQPLQLHGAHSASGRVSAAGNVQNRQYAFQNSAISLKALAGRGLIEDLQDVRPIFVIPDVISRSLFGIFENSVSLDRKSTRLNSSHTVISYAVFCLKKKT